MSGRCRRTRNPSTRRSGDVLPVFHTFTLDELMRLDDVDFDQLDAFDGDADSPGDPEGAALWWALRRAEWREEAASGRQG